jgi:hypothetical protein
MHPPNQLRNLYFTDAIRDGQCNPHAFFPFGVRIERPSDGYVSEIPL